MAGIYLHIPFCKQACAYCNFHFTTSLRYKEDLVTALLQEIDLRKDFLKGEKISTVYFGGGTPSLLSINECGALLNKLRQRFDVLSHAEITLEANPDDITKEKLAAWKEVGINRLSIGIQSFFEPDLKWMNRAHDAKQAFDCIEESLAAGFQNISIDLIYGTPLLTDELWEKNISIATGYRIPHLSCYALTVEEKTPLHKQILLKSKQDVDHDKQARQFLHLMDRLRQEGYEHYEVSNFAKPGYRSRHNSSYWKGEKYLGLGPSAHSFNGSVRQWNVANNNSYVHSITKGEIKSETEVLTPQQKLNEFIMISLRTKEGMNLETLTQQWGEEALSSMQKKLTAFRNNNLLVQTDNQIQLTDEGMLMADGIAADLFVL